MVSLPSELRREGLRGAPPAARRDNGRGRFGEAAVLSEGRKPCFRGAFQDLLRKDSV